MSHRAPFTTSSPVIPHHVSTTFTLAPHITFLCRIDIKGRDLEGAAKRLDLVKYHRAGRGSHEIPLGEERAEPGVGTCINASAVPSRC